VPATKRKNGGKRNETKRKEEEENATKWLKSTLAGRCTRSMAMVGTWRLHKIRNEQHVTIINNLVPNGGVLDGTKTATNKNRQTNKQTNKPLHTHAHRLTPITQLTNQSINRANGYLCNHDASKRIGEGRIDTHKVENEFIGSSADRHHSALGTPCGHI
jgi:hypothetical protein